MADYAHNWTDKELADLEKRIAAAYDKAAKDLDETVSDYFASFAKRDAEMKKLIDTEVNGKVWTERDYKQWRLNQIGRGKRFEVMRDQMAERYTQANEVTTAYINDATPSVYSLNRNYTAYTIDKGLAQIGEDTSMYGDWTMFDESTVRRLLVEQPDVMPYYPEDRALQRGIDLQYGKQQITKQVTSSILQGQSVYKMADELQKNIAGMERTSAVRAARTAMTSAENAGRMDSVIAAEKMGIEMERTWLASLDARTRHEHRMVDGQRRATDKPFDVDGYPMMFPGDKSAPGYLVYNCRCTLETTPKGMGTEGRTRAARNPETGEWETVPFQSYQEWEATQRAKYGDETFEYYQKRTVNRDSDEVQYKAYKKTLGKDAPKTLDEFQEIKYTNAEGWSALKETKRKTTYVNNADCETTPKKFTGYFLKDGAKHSKEFFDVGYTSDSVLALRYDMARNFNIANAVEWETDDNGVQTFSIYMNLGVTTQKQFKTCWRIDEEGNKPRIITAFRKDTK